MKYIVIILVFSCVTLLSCIIGLFLHHRKNVKLLCLVSSPKRGTRAERRLVVKILKAGIHPKAIFHDLYIQRKNGQFSQIDLVIVTSYGLLVIEVKDYSGWIFGNEKQRYWMQLLNYGRSKNRFYNPIIQNISHIKALREQSDQFARLPIFNAVIFDGECTLKDVRYSSDNIFVEYASNITYILQKITESDLVKYTDKQEVLDLLSSAVDNGNNIEIINNHNNYIKSIKLRYK